MSRTPNPLKALNITEKRAIVQEALIAQGFRTNEIAHLTNTSPQRVVAVNKKIQSGTLNPLVAKAKKAIKTILSGKKLGDMGEVRGSDVLTAAKMVMDRADPIINRVESSSKISHVYELKDEDRDRYKKALGIIDAEFSLLPEDQKLIEGSNSGSSSGFDPENAGSSPAPSTNLDETNTDQSTTQGSERVQDTDLPSAHDQPEEEQTVQELH